MMDTVTFCKMFEIPTFSDECWELTACYREATALSEMDTFWEGFEAEVDSFPLMPADTDELEELSDWSVDRKPTLFERKECIVHHDCMWKGICDDKLHPSNACTAAMPQPSNTATDSLPTPTGRSLLRVQNLSTARCATPSPDSPTRPDTPMSLDEDDEPPEFKHQVDMAYTARRLVDCSAVAADHSYTLIKPQLKHPRIENLGVQTPSDSEEEIDVVSLGDKTVTASVPSVRPNLPTNPSPYDCRELQYTVASAISRPREGVARKQISRKNLKRNRRSPGGRRARTAAGKRRSRISSDSEPDVADSEKRSMHNDMERLRRIGLKNLFDELKLQVPSTRDKDRAPKVVILREAANMCRRLAAEDREREALRRTQARLLAKVRRLRTQLAAGR